MTTRRAIHVFAATFVATLALNGCDRPEPANPPPGGAEPGAAPPAEPAAPSGGTWTAINGADGVGLLLTDPNGNGILQLACLRDGKRMVVRVAEFAPIASEERLSFGVDDDPMIFVANLQSPAQGVEAEAPIPLELLGRLTRARTVSVNYGAQNIGPIAPPEPDKAREFETGCRAIAAG